MAARSSTERARLRPPPLQTTALGGAAPQQGALSGTPTSPKPRASIEVERYSEAEQSQLPNKSGHQNFVLTDPVASRYLVEDPSTTVLDYRRELRGYQCYLVEQWTTSRTHPTFMITTFTGDQSHVVIVGVLSVPIDENVWSARLRVYFRALNQYHARRQNTPLGILMVTNLSSFPSSLTVIPVPGGDIKKHRFDFFVNEDLKRLGCSGRVGLNLAPPAAATVAKFHQLYRTSEKNDTYRSVLELVKLCQSALALFDKLEIDYADGLLCDVTERAINDWWVEIGHERYNVEPHDGILGPTTVAGLLGLLMGARNRLHSVNAPVSKDPFDVEAMKKGISAFQKQQHMPRTRRLDRRTLDRLQKATQKAADKDRWAVPKAVKSTMAELSGKGDKMVMDVVGRRDRAGIAEIETVDMDRFVQLVYGYRAKWLWFGKPIKKHKVSDSHDRVEEVQQEPTMNHGLIFKPDDHGGFMWALGRKSTADGLTGGRREQHRPDRDDDDLGRAAPTEDLDEDEEGIRSSVFKRATTIKDEAKSGFGKVKGAVGFRGHRPKPSTDETMQTSPVEQENTKSRRPLLRRALSSPISSPNSPKGQEKEDRVMPSVAEQSNRLNVAIRRDRSDTAESRSMIEQNLSRDSLPPPIAQLQTHRDSEEPFATDTEPSRTVTASASIAGSIYNGVDLNETLPTGLETEAETSNYLRRTLSYNHFIEVEVESHAEESFPRHLSFSLVEDSILHWPPVIEDDTDPFYDEPRAQIAIQELLANESKRLHALITTLSSQTVRWTTSQIKLLQSVLEQTDRDQETLDAMHEPHLQSVRELQVHSEGVLRSEKDRLEEGAKEIEMVAAKLEYEIDGLRSRVDEVARGVGDFEMGVVTVEGRVDELEKEVDKAGWSCAVQ